MFVTDRTEQDVLLRNEKGVYSFSDLNRVETEVANIAALLSSLDIHASLETKTDWNLPGDYNPSTWNTLDQMDRYLGNVSFLREMFYVTERLPSSMRRLTWQGANNIEKVLQKASVRANGAVDAFKYSGEFYAGEV